MSGFMRKRTVVDAVQFLGTGFPRGVVVRESDGRVGVETSHGFLGISHGDFILPDPDGKHFYPMSPAQFGVLYDPVPEEQPKKTRKRK